MRIDRAAASAGSGDACGRAVGCRRGQKTDADGLPGAPVGRSKPFAAGKTPVRR